MRCSWTSARPPRTSSRSSGAVVVAEGRTDPDRLASGELLYTGAVRTPVEALAADVSVQGRHYTLAAEGFATSADVHLWRGDLMPDDVTGRTADGRPATRACAGDRLARALCADRELMDDDAVTALADALASGADGSRVGVDRPRVDRPASVDSTRGRRWHGRVHRRSRRTGGRPRRVRAGRGTGRRRLTLRAGRGGGAAAGARCHRHGREDRREPAGARGHTATCARPAQ